MGFLDRLFGRKQPAEPQDDGIYFFVRCNHCNRVLHTRLHPEANLSPTDSGGYEVRKVMMDDRCFRRMMLTASFDSAKRVTSAEVEGGTLIDRATWLAEKDLPRRPAAPADEPTADL